jgi:hypothetical protein
MSGQYLTRNEHRRLFFDGRVFFVGPGWAELLRRGAPTGPVNDLANLRHTKSFRRQANAPTSMVSRVTTSNA